ncbi:Protein OPI10 [Paramyrothecium foliicola]|nr:Protein OPI10 [Paramyrothecium foliicola]
MSGPLFGIIPAGQTLITEPASTPAPTSFLYTLPSARPFSHIVVFLLPNINIPDNTAAAIYLSTARSVAQATQAGTTPNFRFLGAIGPGKESAVFKVSSPTASSNGDQDLVIGINIEAAQDVAPRLQELAANKSGISASSTGTTNQPSTAVLAQRIIQNAFNFLASFSGSAGPGGIEVVPLKAFEDWWRKFESRVRADPSFLEKQPVE